GSRRTTLRRSAPTSVKSAATWIPFTIHTTCRLSESPTALTAFEMHRAQASSALGTPKQVCADHLGAPTICSLGIVPKTRFGRHDWIGPDTGTKTLTTRMTWVTRRHASWQVSARCVVVPTCVVPVSALVQNDQRKCAPGRQSTALLGTTDQRPDSALR